LAFPAELTSMFALLAADVLWKMEQRLLWMELRVSLVKFYGLLRPSTTYPANSH
jgi:hypothetical protein